MSNWRVNIFILTTFFVLALLSACSSIVPNDLSVTSTQVSEVPSATAISSQAKKTSTEQPSTENKPKAPTNETTSSTELKINPTPRTSAGDWRDAPIMPEISQHVFQIYHEGQIQGRDPHSFSVIGDCQAVPVVFMGPYELGTFVPPENESNLWDVINYFKGSFARWGMSVRGGFTAASVLSPMQADPKYCKSGETPLTCEYRIHNPAFVIITLETWLDPQTVDRYDGYLRRIMDYVIDHGSVPILLTKADSSEMRNGTHVFNPVIIQVAHDYDVPVINFWRAAQYLENGGIDPNREGFHLSQAGYNLKNTLALRTLYIVWKAVNVDNPSQSGSEVINTLTPTHEATNTPSANPVFLSPDCEGGCVFYTTAASRDGVVKFQGVDAYNYLTKKQTNVLGEGFDLQDVSKDGQRLLVNNAENLYEVDLVNNSIKLISDSFYSLGKQGAYWNSNDSSVIFIDKNHPARTETGTAFNLFPSPLDGSMYFESGSCTSQDFCQSAGVFQQNADKSITQLDSLSRPVFSTDGKWMAYLNPNAATNENWYHINYLMIEDPQRGIGSRRIFYLPDDHIWMRYPDIREFTFSPDSTKLFILDDIYSEYFENSLRIETYMVDLETGILYNYGQLVGQSGSFRPRLVWSPDGDKVLFFLTNMISDNKYSLGIFQTKLNTGERLIPYDQDVLVSDEYFYITNIYWR
jgi:hypothetical protein